MVALPALCLSSTAHWPRRTCQTIVLIVLIVSITSLSRVRGSSQSKGTLQPSSEPPTAQTLQHQQQQKQQQQQQQQKQQQQQQQQQGQQPQDEQRTQRQPGNTSSASSSAQPFPYPWASRYTTTTGQWTEPSCAVSLYVAPKYNHTSQSNENSSVYCGQNALEPCANISSALEAARGLGAFTMGHLCIRLLADKRSLCEVSVGDWPVVVRVPFFKSFSLSPYSLSTRYGCERAIIKERMYTGRRSRKHPEIFILYVAIYIQKVNFNIWSDGIPFVMLSHAKPFHLAHSLVQLDAVRAKFLNQSGATWSDGFHVHIHSCTFQGPDMDRLQRVRRTVDDGFAIISVAIPREGTLVVVNSTFLDLMDTPISTFGGSKSQNTLCNANRTIVAAYNHFYRNGGEYSINVSMPEIYRMIPCPVSSRAMTQVLLYKNGHVGGVGSAHVALSLSGRTPTLVTVDRCTFTLATTPPGRHDIDYKYGVLMRVIGHAASTSVSILNCIFDSFRGIKFIHGQNPADLSGKYATPLRLYATQHIALPDKPVTLANSTFHLVTGASAVESKNVDVSMAGRVLIESAGAAPRRGSVIDIADGQWTITGTLLIITPGRSSFVPFPGGQSEALHGSYATKASNIQVTSRVCAVEYDSCPFNRVAVDAAVSIEETSRYGVWTGHSCEVKPHKRLRRHIPFLYLRVACSVPAGPAWIFTRGVTEQSSGDVTLCGSCSMLPGQSSYSGDSSAGNASVGTDTKNMHTAQPQLPPQLGPTTPAPSRSTPPPMHAPASYAVCNISGYEALVVSEFDLLRPILRSAPSWVMLRGISAMCAKAGLDWIYVSAGNCSSMMQALFNTTVETLAPEFSADIQPLKHLASTFQAGADGYTNVLPALKFLRLPWSHVLGVDWRARKPLRIGSLLTRMAVNVPRPCSGDETFAIFPAPGEYLELALDVADDGFGKAHGPVRLEVESNETALMQTGSLSGEYTRVGHLLFHSHDVINGFALAGRVGARGCLRLWILASNSDGDGAGDGTGWGRGQESFALRIPFQLRQSHAGFHEPAPAANKESLGVSAGATDLVMQCASDLAGVDHCSAGKDVIIKAGYWAGDLATLHGQETSEYLALAHDDDEGNLTIGDVVSGSSHANPVLGIGECYNGCCRDTSWRLGVDEPCTHNTTGILCGQCKPGTSLKLATVGCSACSSGALRIPLGAYISLVVVLTVLTFMIMLYCNMGMSPLLDSWLFFVQAFWYIFSNENSYVYSAVYTVLTFGLGHVCIRPDLHPLQVNALLLLQPATFLLIFIAIRVARSYNCTGGFLQRQQQHMLLVRVMWLVLVYSYLLLMFVAISFLSCVKLRTGVRVVTRDGSVSCFGSQHRPYIIISLGILALVIAPPPILLLVPSARQNPRLMGFIDQACHIYRDDRRWWAAVNLLRRVLLAVVCSLFARQYHRLLVMTALFWLMLLAHAVAKPLRSGKTLHVSHNAQELLFLFILQAVSVLKALAAHSSDNWSIYIDKAAMMLYWLPTCFVLLACTCKQLFSPDGGWGRLHGLNFVMLWRRWRRRTSPQEDGDDRIPPEALKTIASGFRTPLLEDEPRLHE
ncbi:uncharacterized protein LOC135819902 [Sycon ciliatum]|uniref:uncharacterized protein LOC135819902 n=1 Tax=Sycon ciliatum TaxID=27933 RepID=UPI0031F6727F